MKSQKILAFGVIVAILLIGSVTALTVEEATELKLSQMNPIERLIHFLSPQFRLMTTAGQERHCSNQPYDSGSLPSSRTVCQGGTEYRLVNYWQDGYNNPYEEYDVPVGLGIFLMGGVNAIYECYDGCDPLPTECTPGDRICWTAHQYAICSNTGTWMINNCASGTECGNGICSSDNVDAICGDDECAPGESNTCPGDCGDDGHQPPPNYCGNGICDSGEASSGSCPSDCGITPPPEAVPCEKTITIDAVEYPETVTPKQDVRVKVTLTNPTSNDCYTNIESGIYIREFGKEYQYFAITGEDIRTCGGILGQESFVNAKAITIPAGETGVVELNYKAPSFWSWFGADAGSFIGKRNWNGYGDDYFLWVGTYPKCKEGYKGVNTLKWITMKQSGSGTGDCGNGQIDEGENCYTCPADASCRFGERCVAKDLTITQKLLTWLTRAPVVGSLYTVTPDYECRPISVWDFAPWIILILIVIGGMVFIFKRI